MDFIKEDLTIRIKGYRTNEEISLVLRHDVKDRYDELDGKLQPFGMYFGDEVLLYDGVDDELVGELVSCHAVLDNWLLG